MSRRERSTLLGSCGCYSNKSTMVRCFIRPVLLQPFLCRPRSSHLAFLVSQRPISYTSNEPKPFLSIASLLGLPSPEHDQFPHPVEVTGHIRTVRNQKRLSFVELGDGSTTQSLQALLEPSLAKGWDLAFCCRWMLLRARY